MAKSAGNPGFERKRFEAKVVGVTADNDDGSSRQDILAELKEFPFYDDLELERFEYEDAPAYRVLCEGRTIGTVSAVLAAKLAERESYGDWLSVTDLRVYGGPTDSHPDKSYGASIDIEIMSAAEVAYKKAELEERIRLRQEKQREERAANAARKLRGTIIKIAVAICFGVWIFSILSKSFQRLF